MTPRLLDLKSLMAYLSLGRDSCRSIGKDAGAVVRYGTKVLYDREQIDRYVERLRSEQ